jgi:hypothetical protein
LDDQVEKNELGRKCSTWGEKRCTHGFGGITEGKRPLGRPRCRWEDNIKMDLKEVGWWGMNWIELAKDMGWWELMNMVMNLWVL